MADVAELGLKIDSSQVVRADKALDSMSKAATKADASVGGLTGEMRRGAKSAKNYKTSIQSANDSSKRLVNSAQNASYQVADLAVQLEGGTSFARAFGQQGSQLLAAFGPYGAIAGAAVAVTAALSGTFFDASLEAQDLSDAIDDLVDSYKDLDDRQRAAKTVAINDSLKEERILRASLSEQIKEQTIALEEAEAAEQKKLNSALLANATDLRRRNATAALRQEVKEEREGLILLNAQLSNSELKTRQYETALNKLSGAYDKQADSIAAALKAEAAEIDAEIELNKETEKSITAAERMVESLREKAGTLGFTTAEAQLYRLELTEGVNPALLAEAAALQKSIDAYDAKTKAQKDAANAAKRDAQAAATEQERINRQAEVIDFQLMTEEEKIRESYERRAKIIEDSTIFSEQRKRQLVADLDKQATDERLANELFLSESIIGIASNQAQQMQALMTEGSVAGKAFFVISQGLAAASAVIDGLRASMAIRVAYAEMAALTANPALAAVGEGHAAMSVAAGVATAGMIAGQTVASFEGGGHTGYGPRTGGMDGKGGFMAMVHPNETVIDHTKGQTAGGAPNIKIFNNGNNQVTATGEGNDIRIVIDEVKKAIGNDISRGVGSVTKAMQTTYKLNRRGDR